MKIKEIRIAAKKADVYDFETPSHSYILGNGLISHNTQEMYSKKVVSGGQGWVLSSNTIFIMGKRQVKDGKELAGFEFVMNTDKSRYIKEKTAVPITVTFEGGIDKYSGLLDIAVVTGHVLRPNNRSYTRPFVLDGDEPETRLWKKSELGSDEFWNPILADQSFKDAVENMFSLTSSKSFTIDEKTGDALVDDIAFDELTGEILED